ncbi:MAG: cobalamin-dependent protein [Rhodoferax sp.]|nr:cobalamin-dependent protein [Rhodoferax sp.]
MTAAAPISEACYQRYLAALLAGDRPGCADLLQGQLAAGVPLKQIYLDLMQRAMYEIGTLWERNLVSVATEHLASATTEVLLALLYPRLFSQAHKDRRALIACVPQEYHQIGARMVADFFELHGWHGFSLGANTPSADLLRSIALHDPDVVGLSMSLLFHRAQLEAMIESVSNAYPALDLLLGGRAFQGDGAGCQAWQELTTAYPRLRYFASLNELEEYLTRD